MVTLNSFQLEIVKYKVITEYILDKNGQRRGALLGCRLPSDQYYTFGWSLCCKKDSFFKNKAIGIAFLRAINGSTASLPWPVLAKHALFLERCDRYFKARLA